MDVCDIWVTDGYDGCVTDESCFVKQLFWCVYFTCSCNSNVRFERLLIELNYSIPNSKVHGTNMGPTWVLSAPDGPHVGPVNFDIWDALVVYLTQIVCATVGRIPLVIISTRHIRYYNTGWATQISRSRSLSHH